MDTLQKAFLIANSAREQLLFNTKGSSVHFNNVVNQATVFLEAVKKEEREACINLIKHYLLFNSQRAVSWHEVNDCIEAIRKRT